MGLQTPRICVVQQSSAESHALLTFFAYLVPILSIYMCVAFISSQAFKYKALNLHGILLILFRYQYSYFGLTYMSKTRTKINIEFLSEAWTALQANTNWLKFKTTTKKTYHLQKEHTTTNK